MQAAEQARVFAGMLLTGALLGAAYDALMLMRLWLGAGRALTGALDLCYGALCAAGICLSALVMQVEAFRWYVFAGALGGMGLYFASIGSLIRLACRKGRQWRQKRRKIGEKMENEAGKRPQRKNCTLHTRTNPAGMDHSEDSALESEEEQKETTREALSAAGDCAGNHDGRHTLALPAEDGQP